MERASNVFQLLGMARRAGAVAPGTEAVRRALRAGEARLVLLASDASQAQLAKISRTMKNHPVPRASLGDRVSLGTAMGLAPLSAVAVTSGPLADKVLAELETAGVGPVHGTED